jgi:hypothetical protein
MTRAESTGQAEQEAPEKVSEKLSRAGEEASAANNKGVRRTACANDAQLAPEPDDRLPRP